MVSSFAWIKPLQLNKLMSGSLKIYHGMIGSSSTWPIKEIDSTIYGAKRKRHPIEKSMSIWEINTIQSSDQKSQTTIKILSAITLNQRNRSGENLIHSSIQMRNKKSVSRFFQIKKIISILRKILSMLSQTFLRQS